MELNAAGAARRMMARLDDFCAFTDEPGKLTRLYLSPSYRAACDEFARLATAAGMSARIDSVGNVRARYEGKAANAPKAPPQVVEVVTTRCAMCHAPEPNWEGIGEAPKGVWLDTPEHIQRFAPAIRMQAVLTHAMPPNNLTEMPQAERAVLARWLEGAAVN